MRDAIDGERLTVYCLESDRHEGRSLYEWLLGLGLEIGLARGTVYKTYCGFGRRRRMHTQKLLALSDDLGIRVEFIDTPPRIAELVRAAGQALERYTFVREPLHWHPAPDDAD